MENRSHYLEEPMPDSILGEVEVVSPEQNARYLAAERVGNARDNLEYIEELVSQSHEDGIDFGVEVDKTVAKLVGGAVGQGALGINIESTVDVGIVEVSKEGDQKETAAALDDAPVGVLSEAMRSALDGGVNIEEVGREIDEAREKKLEKEHIVNSFNEFVKDPDSKVSQEVVNLIEETLENPVALDLVYTLTSRGAGALSVVKFLKTPTELERVGREGSAESLDMIAKLARHDELDFDKSSDIITRLLDQESAVEYQSAIEAFDQRAGEVLEAGCPAERLVDFVQSNIPSPYSQTHHLQFDVFRELAKDRARNEFIQNTPYEKYEPSVEDMQAYKDSVGYFEDFAEYEYEGEDVDIKELMWNDRMKEVVGEAQNNLSKKEMLGVIWSTKLDVMEGVGENLDELCRLSGLEVYDIVNNLSDSMLREKAGYENLSTGQIKERSNKLILDLTKFSVNHPEEYDNLRGVKGYKWDSARNWGQAGIFEQYGSRIEFGESAHSLRCKINQEDYNISATEAMVILDQKRKQEEDWQKVSENLSEQAGLFKDLAQKTGLDGQFLINNLVESDYNDAVKYAEIINTPEGADLFRVGSNLYSIRDKLLRQLSREEQYEPTLRQFSRLSKGDTPLWRLSAELAEVGLGGIEHGSMSPYTIDSIPMSLPNNRDTYDPKLDGEDRVFKRIGDMSRGERDMLMSPEAVTRVEGGEKVFFNDLNECARLTFLSRRLFETIGKSRSAELKAGANRRNRERYESGLGPWSNEGLVHATRGVGSFRQILNTGMMCGETLGLEGKKDRYPYNVDLVAMSQDVLTQESFGEKVNALKNTHYGNILMTLYRGEESTDYLRDTKGGMNDDHRLVFGGVPATEIESIILRGAPEQQKTSVIASVVENDFYIPVYDTDGTLLLDPSQYDLLREDGNFNAVKPEILDTSFKQEGTQAGSNEGAWYIVPGVNQPENWYVKFGDTSQEKTTHVWNELLADSLYREVVPEVSPETKAVVIKGRFARASRSVNLDSGQQVTSEARNEAAVMDMYLGNWDAVFNRENLVMSADGHAMRIDTGNALDFRARGSRKDEGAFGLAVTEIEDGSDRSRLGQGMRQMYPGLTDEMVRGQVQTLASRLDDDTIDRLVDGVRRSSSDRDFLKITLKGRRDYLVQRFL